LAALLAATVFAAPPLARERVAVPAGPFVRGSIRGAEDERPRRTQYLRAFSLDRMEVTRAMYARCVAARRCPAPPAEAAVPPASPARQASQPPQDDGELPMTYVNWYEARAYCAFAGGRLPAEAEWEKAARGPDGREFPWGDDADCRRANWGNYDSEGPCAASNPGRPTPVGRYPLGASPYGALDLGGNVWEWVEDRYDHDEGDVGAAGVRPGGAAGRRVVRGGSCCSYFVEPRAANRNAWHPGHRDADLGFRCAYPAVARKPRGGS
jgi:formylglycine-generating enzyme required for sulfatase activity